MIRQHIYLTEEQKDDIRQRASREGRAEADVIRDLIDRGRTLDRGATVESAQETFRRIEALGLRGPSDLSTRLDDYLYGDK